MRERESTSRLVCVICVGALLLCHLHTLPGVGIQGGSDSHHVRRYLLIQQAKTHTFCH